MAESVTVGELLVRVRADVRDLEAGIKQAETLTASLGSRATPGVRGLESAFRSLAFSAAGVPGPIGRISQILLHTFSPGFIATGVLAGMAAIGAVLLIMEQRAKKVQERFKEMADNAQAAAARMQPLADLLSKVFAVGPEGELQREIAFLEFKRMQEVMQSIPSQLEGGGLDFTKLVPKNVEAVKRLDDALEKLRQKLAQLRTEQLAFGGPAQYLTPGMADRAPIISAVGLPSGVGPRGAAAIYAPHVQVDKAAIVANDRFIQQFMKQVQDKMQTFQMIGQTIGDALGQGISQALSGGSFFGGIFRAILGAGLSIATGLAGRAIGNALFSQASGGFSASMMRNSEWQAFLRNSILVANQYGFR